MYKVDSRSHSFNTQPSFTPNLTLTCDRKHTFNCIILYYDSVDQFSGCILRRQHLRYYNISNVFAHKSLKRKYEMIRKQTTQRGFHLQTAFSTFNN